MFLCESLGLFSFAERFAFSFFWRGRKGESNYSGDLVNERLTATR